MVITLSTRDLYTDKGYYGSILGYGVLCSRTIKKMVYDMNDWREVVILS